MAYQRRDHYFLKAKKENYAARSIFKLQEIDERFKLLRPGYRVLDLGAAPGSWSQYASERTGPTGRVLGIDLQRIAITLPNAYFHQGDLRDIDFPAVFAETGDPKLAPPFDLVLSDMAPKTTGIRVTDQVRSHELCELAMQAADRYLRARGSLVVKLFHSQEFEPLRNALRERYGKVEVLRPKSTRKESKEIFLIGMLKKKDAEAKGAGTTAP